mgnify:CR=1 FL=1
MFKNIIFYNLVDFDLDDDSLTQALQKSPFEPCPKFSLKSTGWVGPAGGDTEYVRSINGATLVTLCNESKTLPGSLIKLKLAEKVAEHKARHQEAPSKKEVRMLKEDVKMELTPNAFPKQTVTNILLSSDRRWLAVDAASASKAEEVLAYLRSDLGSLKVTPLTVSANVEPVFTQWLTSQSLPEKVSLPGDGTLSDQDGGQLTCRNLDLFSDEVGMHLKAGKTVTKLTIDFDQRMTFTLDGTLILKGLKFDGSLVPKIEDEEDDDIAKACYLADGWITSLAPELEIVNSFLNDHFV